MKDAGRSPEKTRISDMASAAPAPQLKMRATGLTVRYGEKVAIHDVNIDVHAKQVLALIGPSGCGKSTFLRALNRMNDTVPGVSMEGNVELEGEMIYGPEIDPVLVRRRVGMVFQRSNPFPKSIFENVAYGLRIAGMRERGVLVERVERALRHAGLWDEVKDRMNESGLSLSGGQQQRLCIARALAANPEVLLLDEPCSALDPQSTKVIEDLIVKLREEVAVVIVTHNLQQAQRVADHVAFMYLGELVEYAPTQAIFGNPKEARTQEYISGAFG
jgi:phosphate transport system ATP-binding protein